MSIEWVGLLIRLHSNCWLDLSLFMNFFLGWKILLSGEKMCEAYLKQVDETLKNGWKKRNEMCEEDVQEKRKKKMIKFIGILETRTINIIVDEVFFLKIHQTKQTFCVQSVYFSITYLLFSIISSSFLFSFIYFLYHISICAKSFFHYIRKKI